MAQITWTNEALRWLEDIFEYIAADNPNAASETVEALFERGPRNTVHGPVIDSGRVALLSIFAPFFDRTKKNIKWSRDAFE